MNWTEGYASDVEYTAGFYREQGPAMLNFACVLNGFEPVAIDKPYTYCELGFGRGLTANILAASNPLGRFYAADFNPAHVAGAQQLADAAQLDNLTLLENSFAEMAEGKVAGLPQFDFITLHGIYTWVTEENRKHIVDFIARYLKPGGIVYLSYNAMPGWSTGLPLHRLLVEHADLNPNRSDVQIKSAAAFIDQLKALDAGYFNTSPMIDERIKILKNASSNYLVHEYMHRHWQPLYHIDVANEMLPAKLDYVGSADLHFAFPTYCFTKERLQLLATIPNSALRETLKDYFLNTSFRKDIFVRGARRIPATRQEDYLKRIGVALLIEREHVKLNIKLPTLEVDLNRGVVDPMLDRLTARPHSLAELAASYQGKGPSLFELAHVIAMLSASNQATIYPISDQQHDPAPALRMNRALSEQTRHSDDYQALASPVLGNGMLLSYIARLTYFLLTQRIDPREADIDTIVRHAWPIMKQQNRQIYREGKLLETDEENIAELAVHIKSILQTQLPAWRHLKMI